MLAPDLGLPASRAVRIIPDSYICYIYGIFYKLYNYILQYILDYGIFVVAA